MVHTVQCNLMGRLRAKVSWERLFEVCPNNCHSFIALAGMAEQPTATKVATHVPLQAAVELSQAHPATAFFAAPSHMCCHNHPDACFKVNQSSKLSTLIKMHAKEGTYTYDKMRPEECKLSMQTAVLGL